LVLNLLLSSSSSSSSFYCKPKTTSSTKLNSNYKDNINNTLLNSSSAKPYGLTFDQWPSKWRQWAYSIPQNINHVHDDTGKPCAINQNGSVWFLTSAYNNQLIDIIQYQLINLFYSLY
jgi:hypothetical protein